MNILVEFEKGQRGQSVGLTTGIKGLDLATNGIVMKTITVVAAAPKVGKTTFVDYSYIIAPYLEWLSLKEKNNGVEPYPLKFLNYSFETGRIDKEFHFAAFFMALDHRIQVFSHNNVQYDMSPDYLKGKLKDPEGNLVPMSQDHKIKFLDVVENRIYPLFGKFDERGRKLQSGMIKMVTKKENPTGIRNDIIRIANELGTTNMETVIARDENGNIIEVQVPGSWIPNDPKQRIIVVLDHIRKLKQERGFDMKRNIDKMSEYFVELRELYGAIFAFIIICHSNRNLADPNRKREAGEFLFTTADDIKDSGNLSEDADFVLTLFNPNDEKYSLRQHFGLVLRDPAGNPLHPHYRSIHLVESRHTPSPQHIQVKMYHNINYLKGLNE